MYSRESLDEIFNKSLSENTLSYIEKYTPPNMEIYDKCLLNLYMAILYANMGYFEKFDIVVRDSINELENKKDKESELNAILSIFYAITLKSKNLFFIDMKIVTKAKFFAELSLKQDEFNIRALYSLALISM